MSEQQKDYYEVLGVSRDADADTLKKSFRRLAMKYHPDKNEGDKAAEEKFKEIKEAYEILADPEKRQAYDQFGHAGVSGMHGGAGPGAGFDMGSIFDEIFGGNFGDMFGGGGGGRRVQRGADLRYHLDLTLEQAVKGCEVKIRVPTWVGCKDCDGSGARKGSKPEQCKDCGGVGQIRMQQGFFSVQQTCPSCRGQGEVIMDPCNKCHGQGRIQEQKTLSVKVPAGVDNGDRIRLAGEGEAAPHGGQSGDLYVQMSIKKHHIFTREDQNLHCEVPISFVVAAMGGEIEVPTLDKRMKLKIPAGTQTGKSFRLRGQGVRSVRGHGVGDLYCHVNVETPINLTSEQKDLLNKFEASINDGGEKHRPKTKSWLDGVKKFFADL